MQMRNNYITTNKPARIEALKAAALECEKQGFEHFASLNKEQAALLQDEVNAAKKAKLLAAEEAE
jgi:hypothetical protein